MELNKDWAYIYPQIMDMTNISNDEKVDALLELGYALRGGNPEDLKVFCDKYKIDLGKVIQNKLINDFDFQI